MLDSLPAFTCFAHRGASGYAPENTLAAIRKALELGAHAIEIDVYLVAGELFVIHDRRLERTTNGRGFIHRKTVTQLRSLEAGSGEKIPFLHEVIDTIGDRALLNIELKGRRTGPPVAALIERYVRNGERSYRQFLASSFLRRNLLEVAEACPQLPIGLLRNRMPRAATLARLKPFSIHPRLDRVNASFVQRAHARGLKVFPYTVNTPQQIARMRDLGVDGVFTNFPDLAIFAEAPGTDHL